MKTRMAISCSLILTSATSTVAFGGIAAVDVQGGEVLMHSRAMESVFNSASPVFTDDALGSLHAQLHDSGITTDGAVTSLLLETADAGLAWVVLIDDQLQGNGYESSDSVLGMTSTGPANAGMYVNDEATDVLTRLDLGNGSALATGLFSWDSTSKGDGFAWSDLSAGDFVSFNFNDQGAQGIDGANDFQFLSWSGSSWDVVASANFSENGNYAYSFTIVPAPGVLALIGCSTAAFRRRRRS